ncbi:hypothetical protein ACCO45_000112 [Purpureocillium lilacinum]|uniref:Uncharacterized protein n=1 Tax=Purpureocillium lilacinum TaxID=33203 RepID=A0ACC4E4F0_PURLI
MELFVTVFILQILFGAVQCAVSSRPAARSHALNTYDPRGRERERDPTRFTGPNRPPKDVQNVEEARHEAELGMFPIQSQSTVAPVAAPSLDFEYVYDWVTYKCAETPCVKGGCNINFWVWGPEVQCW